MSGRAGGGPIRRRSARLAKIADKKSDPVVLHEPNDLMHLAIIKQKDQQLLDDTMNSSISDTGLHEELSEMHCAIVRHDIELVQRLLDKGDTFCMADGLNCFILAATSTNDGLWEAYDCWDMVEKMLFIDSKGVLARDEDGSTLLSYFWAELEIVQQILDWGVDLGAVEKYGQTICESLFCSPYSVNDPLEGKRDRNLLLLELWKLLMNYKEFQKQVVEHKFVKFLVTNMNGSECYQFMFFDITFVSNLISIDVNFVNSYGKDLLEKLFCACLIHIQIRSPHDDDILKLWKTCMKYEEFQSQVKEINPRVPCQYLARSYLAKKMFHDIMQLNLMSIDELTTKLKMHPLFFILKENNCRGSLYLYIIEFLLAEQRKKDYSAILKDKTIVFSADISDFLNVYRDQWEKVMKKLNIPDIVTFDFIGYFLYQLKMPQYPHDCFERDGAEFPDYLRLLLEQGFVPVGTPGVVHPIHALIYNIFRHHNGNIIDYDEYNFENGDEYLLPEFLLKTIYILKDFPLCHQLVLDAEAGLPILDVHLLMSPLLPLFAMMCSDRQIGTPFLDCVKAFMPLSPAHPLQHFASFYSLGFQPDYIHDFNVVATYSQLFLYSLKASGRHTFQAVDQKTIECVNLFFENLEKLELDVKEELEDCGLLINTSTKAENQVGSLLWLSILQIRKTLFLRRSDTSTYLPSLVRSLIAESRLPKGLEEDLLVYRPNPKLNF